MRFNKVKRCHDRYYNGCNKQCDSLCNCHAIAMSRLAILSNQTSELTIPDNAGITKIFASVIGFEEEPINGAIFEAGPGDQLNFSQVIGVDPVTQLGEFMVTVDQPVCVGPEGATFNMSAFRAVGEPVVATMSFTVAYCPEICNNE